MVLVRGSIVLVVLVAVACLAPAASAQVDQARVTDTRIKVSVNPFLSEGNTLAREDSTFGFLVLNFCHGTGGMNPQEGKFHFTFEFTGNEPWFEVVLSTEPTLTVTPPRGPTFNQQEDCPPDGQLQWDLVATATRDAPYDAVGEIQITISVEEEGSLGTYKAPQPQTAVMNVRIQADPGEDQLQELENATRNPTAPTETGGGTESEDGPLPGFVATTLVLAALAAVVRRRGL